MPEVESSAIRALHYDRRRRELLVTFINSGAYVYYEVPEQVYDALLAAPSIGAFYNDHIKHGYSWRKL